MMTRKEFEAKAIRREEQRLGMPPGWWGTYTKLFGPGRVIVAKSMGSWVWVVRVGSLIVSKHDSREYAIRVARKLGGRR